MSVSARYTDLLHLVAALSSVSFLVADEQAFLLVVALPVIGVSWLLCRGERADTPPAIPRIIVNVLVLCVIVYAVLRTAGPRGDEPIVSTLGQFLVMLTLLKLFDRRAERDDAQLMALSVFVAIAAVLTSNALLVGAALLGVLPAVIMAAMLWQVRAGQIRLHAAAKSAGIGPAAQRHIGAPIRGFRSGFVGIALAAVFSAMVFASILFVVIPRGFGSEILGRFGVVRETRIGFRESVQLGQAGLLSEDPTPVMDVKITTGDGETYGSEHLPIYLRGGARDQYDPERRLWQESTIEDARAGRGGFPGIRGSSGIRQRWASWFRNRRVVPIRAEEPRQVDLSPGVEWTIRWPDAARDLDRSITGQRIQRITVRREVDSNILFALWRPVGITVERSGKLIFAPEFGTLRRTEKLSARTTYTVRSLVGGDQPLPIMPELGFQQGQVADLAASILKNRDIPTTGPEVSPRQIAMAIRDHLHRNYTYTTEMIAPPEGVDPIDYFLSQSKQGHCEYFASAMTALCQSVGLPARVVSGYLSTEFSSSSGQYLIRESNAHAWVEVFITTDTATGRGRWELFDPSPPSDIERVHRPPSGVLASMRSWYEALELGWASSVVGFDLSAQRRLFGARQSEAPAALQSVSDRLVSWLSNRDADARNRSTIPAWIRWTPVIIASAVVLGFVLYRWFLRRRSPKLAKQRSDLRAMPTFYRRALKSLARAGLARPQGRPALAHAHAVARDHPDLADALLALTRRYYQVRFAGVPLTTSDMDAARAELRKLQALLARRHQPRSKV
ncbi:MAG: DUF3488 and transglutaminase-like domain-containing protein [Phycisphaerales bacterium]|nr:DUF3488 and transglutaminase-like domain-containing protein [Phycisphaerales bacterium]